MWEENKNLEIETGKADQVKNIGNNVKMLQKKGVKKKGKIRKK